MDDSFCLVSICENKTSSLAVFLVLFVFFLVSSYTSNASVYSGNLIYC